MKVAITPFDSKKKQFEDAEYRDRTQGLLSEEKGCSSSKTDLKDLQKNPTSLLKAIGLHNQCEQEAPFKYLRANTSHWDLLLIGMFGDIDENLYEKLRDKPSSEQSLFEDGSYKKIGVPWSKFTYNYPKLEDGDSFTNQRDARGFVKQIIENQSPLRIYPTRANDRLINLRKNAAQALYNFLKGYSRIDCHVKDLIEKEYNFFECLTYLLNANAGFPNPDHVLKSALLFCLYGRNQKDEDSKQIPDEIPIELRDAVVSKLNKKLQQNNDHDSVLRIRQITNDLNNAKIKKGVVGNNIVPPYKDYYRDNDVELISKTFRLTRWLDLLKKAYRAKEET